MTPLRLFLRRARFGVAFVVMIAVSVPGLFGSGTSQDRFDRPYWEGLNVGSYFMMAGVLAFAVWRLALLRRVAPPDVKAARHRLWALLIAVTVIASGPSVGFAARVLAQAAADGPERTLAAVCEPQGAVALTEGQLQGALRDNRLLVELPAEACAPFADTRTGRHVSLTSVPLFPRHRPPTWVRQQWDDTYSVPDDHRLSSTRAWRMSGESYRTDYLRATFAMWTLDEVRSRPWPLAQVWLRDVLRAWAIVFCVFAFPFARRRSLRPELELARVGKLTAVALAPMLIVLVMVAEAGVSSRHMTPVGPVTALFVVSAALLASVVGWSARGTYTAGLNVAWGTLNSLILAAALYRSWRHAYAYHDGLWWYHLKSYGRPDPWLWEPWVTAAVLAAMVVYVPLYAAINERIRVLPE